jgi:hypothetical protein
MGLGGGNRWICEKPGRRSTSQNALDLALAQATFAKYRKSVRAVHINKDPYKGVTTYIYLAAKDLCRKLAQNPFLQLTQKQRAMFERALGPEVVAQIKAQLGPPEIPAQALPLKPPGRE